MKLIKNPLCIYLLFLLHSSFSQAVLYPSPEQSDDVLALQFESIFPDSSYKKVHNLCIDMWQDLRTIKDQKVPINGSLSINEMLIDDLMLLSRRVADMLGDPHCCSADDLEYIMEILQIMHCEYVNLLGPLTKTDQSICISVLFDHITRTLNKPLDSVDWFEKRKRS
jgi:hypothetical protein